MTVAELIEKLNKFPSDTDVTAWLDGERKEVLDIDDSFFDEHSFIEINIG